MSRIFMLNASLRILGIGDLVVAALQHLRSLVSCRAYPVYSEFSECSTPYMCRWPVPAEAGLSGSTMNPSLGSQPLDHHTTQRLLCVACLSHRDHDTKVRPCYFCSPTLR